MTADTGAEPRATLTRERVLRAAIDLADREGLAALSMRKLGQEVGVEAMSLYNHVANKDDILDGVVDMILSEINAATSEIDASSGDWKAVLRQRVLTARSVLLQHRWVTGVLESRNNTGVPMMRYFDSTIGVLRSGGFSYDLIHHALHALGSRALGFSQEPFDDSEDLDEDAMAMFVQQVGDEFPHITEMLKDVVHDADTTLGWCDDQFEFEFALDLLLDGLERRRDRA
jgi:AcrR family transcriptional regulator